METIVKVERIVIENLKNVAFGEIQLHVDFKHMRKANVMGLYGQNGSGKTTVVNAFELLKILLSSAVTEEKLPPIAKHLIHIEAERAKLTFDFLVRNQCGEFFVQYHVELVRGVSRLYPVVEELHYRENAPRKRMKLLAKKDGQHIQIRTQTVEEMKQQDKIAVMVTNQLSERESTSFLFHKELQPMLESYLKEVEWQLIQSLTQDFNRDLYVINNENIGFVMTKYLMPFSVYLEQSRGMIPYNLSEPALLPKPLYDTLCQVIEQINYVLSAVIPGLKVEVREIATQLLDNGEQGVRFEFLSNRNGRVLPLRTESEGILKIIAVLSALAAAYNKPNACIVIDELDSGVFEYLLGELLKIIAEAGQGQLFFTSHNLRLLEVLTTKDLWFTTSNEQRRYIQLKGVKTLHNTRDVYLRAIQLGGQDESVYEDTKSFHIKKAFWKARRGEE
ncbi:AAA family ATPase [Lysinibacillus sp. KU-BSD001]|uniref:AAA family ATPase n=1 Tax=Lysinibacillus sp. KU-BSD001 TaxID=3141328 RepID=UPI0036E76229